MSIPSGYAWAVLLSCLVACVGDEVNSENLLLGARLNSLRHERLTTASALHCPNPRGIAAGWIDAGEVRLGKPGPMFSVPTTLIFDEIDTAQRTARFTGNAGVEKLAVWVSAAGLHFLEETPAGSVNLTTVFSIGIVPIASDSFYFVHSRHVVGGEVPPIVSQYTGKCGLHEF
jgi:hypothetical protein